MSDTIKDAYTLFIRKKYTDVINLLEPQVFRFRENFHFFYLLGMSCLFQGDYGGAFSYLRRAVDLRENDVKTLLGIAAVYLKRGDTGNALRIWLDVTEIEPGNIFAQRGLNYLKKNNDPDVFNSLDAQDKILRFLPSSEKRKKSPVIFLTSAAIIICLTAVVFIIPVSRNFIAEKISLPGIFSAGKTSSRPEIPEISLDVRKDFIDLDGNFSYVLTEKEIEKKMKLIQDYLYDFRDNLAQKEINLILLSNASEYVKDRARLLSKYIQQPELTTFKDNFDFSDISSEPLLYDGCFVLWKGKAVNISETPQSINFDFLVGYHEEKVLEGSVPVFFDFAITVIPDQPIELLGKLLFDENRKLSLKGISIHRL